MSRMMGEHLNLALALEGRTAARGEARELVALAQDLGSLPEPKIDETWAAALEARLLTEGLDEAPAVVGRPQLAVVEQPIEQPAAEPVRRAPVVTLPRRRMVVRRSVAAVAAAAMLGAFPVAAAASSLPGSPFYGLKRTMERAQIAMFGGAIADGFAHMDLADRRLGEAEQLSALGRGGDAIAALLADADESMRIGSALILGHTTNPEELTRLALLAGDAKVRAQGMQPGLPDDAAHAANAPIATAGSIQDQVADALGAAPDAEIEVPAAVEPVVSAPSTTLTSSSGSTGAKGSNSSKSGTSGSKSTVTRTTDSEPTGTGKDLSGDERRGCEIPGSADGFGDLFAIATKFWC